MNSGIEAKPMSLENRHFAAIAGGVAICGAVVTICDFLQKVAPFAWFAIIGSAVALTLVSWLRRRLPATRSELTNMTIALGILLVGSGGLKLAQVIVPNANANGILAAKIETVADLQSYLIDIGARMERVEGGVRRIEQTTQTVDHRVQSIERTGQSIDLRTQDIQQSAKLVKRETSGDPKKELANRGISWTRASLGHALKQEDVETIRLFLAGQFDWALAWNTEDGNQYMRETMPTMRRDIFDLFISQKEIASKVICDIPEAGRLAAYPHAGWHSAVYYKALFDIAKRAGKVTIRELCGTSLVSRLDAHRSFWEMWIARESRCQRERAVMCDGHPDIYKNVDSTRKVHDLLNEYIRFLN